MTSRPAWRWHRERILLFGAIGWAATLLPLALVLPVESPPYRPSGGGAAAGDAMESLVRVQGIRILLVVMIPLAVSLAVGVLLAVEVKRGWAVAGWSAWGLAVGLTAVAVLGTVTFLIGIYVLPTGITLVWCCRSQRARRPVLPDLVG